MHKIIMMENYLLVLKSTVEVYVHGTLESSNELVRNTISVCMQDTLSSQNNTSTNFNVSTVLYVKSSIFPIGVGIKYKLGLLS